MTKPAEVVTLNPNQEIEDELARVRARRAEIAAAREAREEADAAKRKLDEEKLALENEEAIVAAEAAHGPVGKRIALVFAESGVVIVKRAHAVYWKRYVDRGEFKTKNLDELIRHCLVHPSVERYEEIVMEQPALLHRLSDAIAGLAGVRAEDVQGKP